MLPRLQPHERLRHRRRGVRYVQEYRAAAENRDGGCADLITVRNDSRSDPGPEFALSAREAKLRSGEQIPWLPGRDDLHINSLFGRFRNTHGFTLLLERPQEIRIEVGVFLDGVPGEDLVFTWLNAVNDEMTI